jgi:hypothetical protein
MNIRQISALLVTLSAFVSQAWASNYAVSGLSVDGQMGALSYGTAASASFNLTNYFTGSGGPVKFVTNNVIAGLPSGASAVFALTPVRLGVSGKSFSTNQLTVSIAPNTAPGNYTITVVGDDNASGHATNTTTLVVNKAATAGTLAASSNPALPGVGVTFTNILSEVAPGAGTPSGAVQFRTNGVLFGNQVPLSGFAAVSATTTALLHGSNLLTAEYVGDANFAGSTNTLSLIVNTPPVARTVITSIQQGGIATINFDLGKYKLATDADGDALGIISAFGAASGNLAVAGNGQSMTYANISGTPGSTDTYSFVVRDTFGGLATNTVSVRIDANGSFNQLATSGNTLSFVGIPGATYALEHTGSFSPPNWTSVTTNVVGVDGRVLFNLGASPNGFYRTRYVTGP